MATLKNRRKKSTAIVAAGLTLVGTVGAYAWWSATGTAEDDAQTGVATAFTVTVGARVGDPLTPGGPEIQTMPFTVANTATNAQQIGVVSIAVAEAGGATWDDVVGCSAADYTVTITDSPVGDVLQPNTSVDGEATITMDYRDADQNGCQNALVPLFFNVAV